MKNLLLILLLLPTILFSGENSFDRLLPIGSVVTMATQTCPTSFLLGDGTSYLRTAYPKLFAAIGTAHGFVDATHFNVPDYRGRGLRGADGGSSRDTFTRTAMNTGANTTGVGSVQNDATKRNGLAIVDPGHSHVINVWFSENGTGPFQPNIQGYGNTGPFAVGTTVASSSNTSISAGDAETVMKNAAVIFCIKY